LLIKDAAVSRKNMQIDRSMAWRALSLANASFSLVGHLLKTGLVMKLYKGVSAGRRRVKTAVIVNKVTALTDRLCKVVTVPTAVLSGNKTAAKKVAMKAAIKTANKAAMWAALFGSTLMFNSLPAAAADIGMVTTPSRLIHTQATPIPALPGSQYAKSIPTTTEVLGYALGERISDSAAALSYFQALMQAAPKRMKLVQYGKSAAGRPLFYAVIGSAEQIAKLAETEASMRKLANPQGLAEDEAKALLAKLPASVWFSSTLHGNELSPVDSALALAYHLLADESSATAAVLQNTLVYIEPVQNPDGHQRFVSRYYATVGLEHSADRFSAEHNEPWPNGRTNHYLFDMNRDWVALTQPEIQQRVKVLQQMFPLVYVDSHEMSGDQSYYFSPEAEPFNPYILPSQREALNWFGEGNAKAFDKAGYDYFTREIFDAFFPGYGASWPLYYGGIAMTYEMGSARGHAYRKQDGSLLTFADGVQRNFVAFTATLATASRRSSELLQRFYQYRKDALNQGNKALARSYLFPASRDVAGHQKMMAVLSQHGIEVRQASRAFNICGKDYQAGSYFVSAAQPSYYLIRAVLDEQVDMDAAFIKSQEDRRANNLPDQMYDVTAWSLPLMYNLEMQRCNKVPDVASTVVGTATILPGQVQSVTASNKQGGDATDALYGYIVPWGDMAAARLLSQALQQGIKVKSSDLPFTHQNGKRYPAGSLILTNADNPQLADQIKQLAEQSGAVVDAVNSSWVTDGPNFVSGNVKLVPKVAVAMLWDEPTDPLSAGSARFVLERFAGYPVTAIRPAQLVASQLSGYDVLILPATLRTSYQTALSEAAATLLRRFVSQGGVIISLGNATEYLINGEQPLLASKQEFKANEQEKPADDNKVAGKVLQSNDEYNKLLQPFEADPDWVPGFLANANVDQNHWLTAGVPPALRTVYVGNQVYQPLSIDNGRNVVTFAEDKKLLASGFVWRENREQIALKPVVMVQPYGRGQVIAFTQEPNFRAAVDGMHLLYINAVFRGAANASPLR